MVINYQRRKLICAAPALCWQKAWAFNAPEPLLLSGWQDVSGNHYLLKMNMDGVITTAPMDFEAHQIICLDNRGDELVAISRRPGTIARYINFSNDDHNRLIQAPEGMHFFGHALFDHQRQCLWVSGQDNADNMGRLFAYGRERFELDEIRESHGVEPHQIKRMAQDEWLIAHGGMESAPEFGRRRMHALPHQSRLTRCRWTENYFQHYTPIDQSLSVRHVESLAVGSCLIGARRNAAGISALVYVFDGQEYWPLAGTDTLQYALSLAVGEDYFAATFPLDDCVVIWQRSTLKCLANLVIAKPCGITASKQSFIVTTRTGELVQCHGLRKAWRSVTKWIRPGRFSDHLYTATMQTYAS